MRILPVIALAAIVSSCSCQSGPKVTGNPATDAQNLVEYLVAYATKEDYKAANEIIQRYYEYYSNAGIQDMYRFLMYFEQDMFALSADQWDVWTKLITNYYDNMAQAIGNMENMYTTVSSTIDYDDPGYDMALESLIDDSYDRAMAEWEDQYDQAIAEWEEQYDKAMAEWEEQYDQAMADLEEQMASYTYSSRTTTTTTTRSSSSSEPVTHTTTKTTTRTSSPQATTGSASSSGQSVSKTPDVPQTATTTSSTQKKTTPKRRIFSKLH